MPLDPWQIAASALALLVASVAAGLVAFGRGAVRRAAYVALCACACLAAASWLRFGALHTLWVDTGAATGKDRPKVERHLPLQFHEVFHYYLGAKYFRELGYLHLYECAALGDLELAQQEGVAPRLGESVRALGDVLAYEPYERAVLACAAGPRAPGGVFSDARWAAFKADLAELQRWVPDEAWPPVVDDAGFNLPPSGVLLYSAAAHLIPLRAWGLPTWVLATSLDLGLLAAALLALRAWLGRPSAALAAVFFGASFVADYGWIGGALLRMLWVAALVGGLAAMKRGRWTLAGALLAVAIADRVFPAAFLLGAAVPLAWSARRDPGARATLWQLATGAAVTLAALVLASRALYGAGVWGVFVERTLRYDDLYLVLHLGLKKLLTFRSWTADQDFHGPQGLAVFAAWNARLQETWRQVRAAGLAVQLVAVGGVALAGARRRPDEAAVLAGLAAMFLFTMPASYYFVVLPLAPAVLLRDAAVAPAARARLGSLGALVAWSAFALATLVAPRLWPDGIVVNFGLCALYAAALAAWIAAWGAAALRAG